MRELSILLHSMRILEIESNPNKVMFGTKVEVYEINNNKKVTYRIVGSYESSVLEKEYIKTKNSGDLFIAYKSPMGKSLIGKKIGDLTEVNVPSGNIKMEIMDIKGCFDGLDISDKL